jgi:hypothetical protein
VKETSLAEHWLYDTLTADPQIGSQVFKNEAPEEAEGIFVVFSFSSPEDVTNAYEERIFSSIPVTVKAIQAVQPGSLTSPALLAVAERFDALLDRKRAVLTGGEVLACVREGPLDYSSFEEGIVYQHLGGQYRLEIAARTGQEE